MVGAKSFRSGLLTSWRPGDQLWKPRLQVEEAVCHDGNRLHHEGVDISLVRRNRRGNPYIQNRLRLGPNYVHAAIFRKDGSVEDLGVSRNLLTNIGRDWWLSAMGFAPAGNTLASNISTGVGATSITGTGSVWTASNLGTPQLGAAGMRVYAAPHTTTNPVVWGNIISNTTNVLTIDQWWKLPAVAGGVPITGTTPTSGDAFVVANAGMAGLQFMALSTNASAAAAADNTLTGEVTTNGGQRVLAAYAHTMGTSSCTLSNTFTASGTITAIHKIGLFTTLSAAGADPMIYETVLNADATLASGDTLAVTWTPTLTG